MSRTGARGGKNQFARTRVPTHPHGCWRMLSAQERPPNDDATQSPVIGAKMFSINPTRLGPDIQQSSGARPAAQRASERRGNATQATETHKGDGTAA
jgi:hypothetical protein